MRTLSSKLLAAQQAMSAKPYIHLVVGAYTFESSGWYPERLISYELDEAPFSDKLTVLLANDDGYLTGLALEGCTVTLGQGFTTLDGNESCDKPPLRVLKQTFLSSANGLYCQLECAGMCSDLDNDKASTTYTDDSTEGVTLKTQLTGILGATLAPFTDCPARTIEWGTLDSLIDTVKLKKTFQILTNGSRLAACQRLLSYTFCAMRPTYDSKFKIFAPVTSGTTYDYQYALNAHIFDSKDIVNRLTVPNHVIVRTPAGTLPAYTGEYTDADSINKYRDIRYYKDIASLVSNAQAADIAHALLARYQIYLQTSVVVVPVNVGAEIYDYIKATDSREGTTVTGNIWYMRTKYNTRENVYHTTIGLGGWRPPDDSLLDSEAAQSLTVSSLTLEPINLDFVEDGVTYKRVQSAALNASGLVLLDQTVGGTYERVLATQLSAGKLNLSDQCSYASGYNPTTKEMGIPKQATAPGSPVTGQLWQDTSTTPNVIKWWNGSAWIAAGVSNLDQLPNGTTFKRTASAALDANGLVLLDQVSIGTTYGLVSKTDISSGHIKLSSTVQDSSHHTVSDTDIATWNAKPNNMDQVADGSTYARVRGSDLSAGYIMLYSGTIKAGVWYDEGGVEIDVASGIKLTGDTAIQFYYGSSMVMSMWAESTYFVIKAWGGQYIYMGGQGLLVPQLSSAPVAQGGLIYYNTTDNYFWAYSDGGWRHI